MRMFKISSTDKNGAPNDFSQILVDPILLIYHIIAKIKRKLSLRSRYALDTVFLDFTVSRVEKTLQDFRVNILEKTVDLVHFEVSQRFYI